MTIEEPSRHDELAALERGGSSDAAFAFFDSLPPASIEQMMGHWRGSELPTSHPMDGLLSKAGWHGKRFDDADAAHPLVFARADQSLFAINPAWIPFSLLTSRVGLAQKLANPALVRVGAFLAGTKAPKARLRMTEYRGVVSATMIYDALPINDVFRAVDADTLIGAMDMRGHDVPFFFTLRREASDPFIGT